MSGDLIAVDGAAASAALEQLWRASWQGGTAMVLVWGVCRMRPRTSPRVRCWLWRLAYLKLLAALVWVAPVELPVLPAEQTSGMGSRVAAAPAAGELAVAGAGAGAGA